MRTSRGEERRSQKKRDWQSIPPDVTEERDRYERALHDFLDEQVPVGFQWSRELGTKLGAERGAPVPWL